MRKYAVLSKYLSALSVDFACIQEHHITSPELENTLRKHFNRLRYHIMLNSTSAGRGGVGLIWKHSWVCQEAVSLDCSPTLTGNASGLLVHICTMITILENLNGCVSPNRQIDFRATG